MTIRFSVFSSLVLILLAAGLLSGCASSGARGSVLAVVDGTPITEGDLTYSLEVAHRRENLKGAGALDLSGYLDELIKRRLMIDEAYRMGLDKDPDIVKKTKDFILYESVTKLHSDEIVGKVSVSDRAVREVFSRDYEKFILQLIETDSPEKADSALKRLGEKADFGDLAKELSTHKSAKDGGKVEYTRKSLDSSPIFRDAVMQLKPGGVSGVVDINGKYYIIKLVSREKAPEDLFEKLRKELKAELRQPKEKERSDEYLRQIRKGADIEIKKEILSGIKLDAGNEELKKYLKDERPLARVYDQTITVAEFVKAAAADSAGHSSGKKTIEEMLDNWVNFQVVNHEALRRNYEAEPGIRDAVERYRDELMLRAYVTKVIRPEVKFTEEALQKYYDENKDAKYSSPVMYQINQMSLDDHDKALDALKKLRSGAEFSWVAEQEAAVSEGEKQAGAGWITKDRLPVQVGEVIDTLRKGQVSDVVEIGASKFTIIKLLDKKDKKPIGLEKIKKRVYEDWYRARIRELVEKYEEKLLSTASIKINKDELKKLRDRFGKTKPVKDKS